VGFKKEYQLIMEPFQRFTLAKTVETVREWGLQFLKPTAKVVV
jgi:hypothetical protein